MSNTRSTESRAASNTLLSQLGFADKDRQNGRHDLAVSYAVERRAQLAQLLTPDGHHAWNEECKINGSEIDCRALMLTEVRVCRPDLKRPDEPSAFLVGFADGILEWPIHSMPWAAYHAELQRLTAEYEGATVQFEAAHARACERLGRKICIGRSFYERNDLDSYRQSPRSSLYDGIDHEVYGQLCALDDTRHALGSKVGDLRYAPQRARAIVEVKISKTPAGDIIRQIESYRGGITACGRPLAGAPGLAVLDYAISSAEHDMLTANHIFSVRLGESFETFIKTHSHHVSIPEL